MAVTWRRLAYYDEITSSNGIVTYRIATGETVILADYEQLFIADEYIIEGTGTLTINDSGLLAIH